MIFILGEIRKICSLLESVVDCSHRVFGCCVVGFAGNNRNVNQVDDTAVFILDVAVFVCLEISFCLLITHFNLQVVEFRVGDGESGDERRDGLVIVCHLA